MVLDMLLDEVHNIELGLQAFHTFFKEPLHLSVRANIAEKPHLVKKIYLQLVFIAVE